MDLQPDTLLNKRYRVQRKLGQGGMGVVYLALDVALDHEVALKANLHPAPESTNQFLREARLLAALRHPNLPRVTDYFILDGVQYLVMDYIPGKDLDTLLKERGRLPLAEVLGLARQIGSAVSYMHRQNPPVIHRDIKPGNIRLTIEGEAVLVDFGIAKAILSDAETETQARGYTPGFAPPEQYGGMRTGPHSDQFSMAATFYTLLAGQKPSDAIQRTIGQAVLTPLTAFAPEVPVEIQSALERAMAVRPEDRFTSVEQFMNALVDPFAQPTVFRAPSRQPALIEAAPPAPPPAPPLAPPAATRSKSRGGRGWLLWAVIGAGGLSVVGLLSIGALFLLTQARQTPILPTLTQAVAAVVPPTDTLLAVLLTDTPRPPEDTSVLSTETLPPPAATMTLIPPTATLPPLGEGGLIAFASDRSDGQTLQIWTLRAALNDQGQVVVSDLTQLTSGEGDKIQPRWSPDGTKLLYVAPGEGANGLDIWMIPADGSGTPLNLSQRKGDDTEPAWSPDGALIAFTNNGREDELLQLYLMNSDGSGQMRLSFDQEEFGPAWSPDMQYLAFVMNASGFQILNLREQTDPGVEPRPFYATPQRFDFSTLTGSLGQVAQPVWSPDGSWMAYTRQEGAVERVFLARFPLRVPDQDVVKLTDSGKDSAPAWSPDSQWLAYNSARDGNPEVYVMRANGQGQSNLSSSPGIDQDPVWKP
jgi:Tol biopolymer transport system component